MDITGDGAMEFFSNRVKVTSKWPIVRGTSRKRRHENGAVAMNGNGDHHVAPAEEAKDAANFAGQM